MSKLGPVQESLLGEGCGAGGEEQGRAQPRAAALPVPPLCWGKCPRRGRRRMQSWWGPAESELKVQFVTR